MKYYEQIVRNRNSCRQFADRKVDNKVLNELLTYYEDEESVLVDSIETELRFYVGTRLQRFLYQSSCLYGHLLRGG